MAGRNLLNFARSQPPGPERSTPEAPQQGVLVVLAGRLDQLTAESEAAYAALAAIDKRPADVRRVNPGADERAAAKRLELCRMRLSASVFAGECLALHAAIRGAAPVIEARVRTCREIVGRAQAQFDGAAAAASSSTARLDALTAQREAAGLRQADIDDALARLARAADAGDDAGADDAARDVARIRREHLDAVEPLDLRLQAARDAATRADAARSQAQEQLTAALGALREAEHAKLMLARDEAAATLRDRDIELAAAGYTGYGWPRATQYPIGLTPELLERLGGRRQDVSFAVIETRAKERRAALEPEGTT